MKRRRIKIGDRFGRWTVIDTMRINSRLWLCECECGNQKYNPASALLSGKTTSCGCGRAEAVKKAHAKRKEKNR
jgi:hypothetical protein